MSSGERSLGDALSFHDVLHRLDPVIPWDQSVIQQWRHEGTEAVRRASLQINDNEYRTEIQSNTIAV